MILNKIFPLFFVIFCFIVSTAQDSIKIRSLNKVPQEWIKTDEFGQKYYYDEKQKAKIYEINGEMVVVLDELILIKGSKFNNQLDRNYYYFLNKKLLRVYPLFLKALEEYNYIKTECEKLQNEEKRKFVRNKYNELANQFEKQLKELTTTEGNVFAKLMSRATGKTVYEIIKELRGGWSAFWWNVKGNVFDIELKEPYDTHKNRSDYFLESLLQTHWNKGLLQPYPGASEYKNEE